MTRQSIITMLEKLATTHDLVTGKVELHVDDIRQIIDELALLNIEHPPITPVYMVRQRYGDSGIDHPELTDLQEADNLAKHIVNIYDKARADVMERYVSAYKVVKSYKGEKAK